MKENPAAFVLAGSRGLGFASAAALSAAGHPVAICGRSAEGLDEAIAALPEGVQAIGLSADVSDGAELASAVKEARSELGPIGVLVANAGGPPPGSFDDLTDDEWDVAYDLTLMSFVRAVRLVLPDMRSLGGGRIVLIASSSIRRPIANLTLSNAMRPALAGLAKDLAVTYAPDSITVNVVAPGRVDTDRVRSLDLAAAQRRGLDVAEIRRVSESSIPMGRYGKPDEFGAVVGFLASPEASYVTGQSILVDGGMTASLP